MQFIEALVATCAGRARSIALSKPEIFHARDVGDVVAKTKGNHRTIKCIKAHTRTRIYTVYIYIYTNSPIDINIS